MYRFQIKLKHPFKKKESRSNKEDKHTKNMEKGQDDKGIIPKIHSQNTGTICIKGKCPLKIISIKQPVLQNL